MLVIGIGTGRCGTVSLAQLLNRQEGARVTHESNPILPWRKGDLLASDVDWLMKVYGETSATKMYYQHVARFSGRANEYSIVGDVASGWIRYLGDLHGLMSFKLIALVRDRDRCIASYVRQNIDIFTNQDSPWSIVVPQYDLSRQEATERYYDEYNELLYTAVDEYDGLVVKTEELSMPDTQREIFAYLGIDGEIGLAHYNESGSGLEAANGVREDRNGNEYILKAIDGKAKRVYPKGGYD